MQEDGAQPRGGPGRPRRSGSTMTGRRMPQASGMGAAGESTTRDAEFGAESEGAASAHDPGGAEGSGEEPRGGERARPLRRGW